MIDLDNDRVTISGVIELILDQWTGEVIGRRAQLEPVLQRVVPTLVYVCSETPDLRPMPVAAAAARPARLTRSATSAQVMELGWRVGKALLAWRRTHDAGDGDGVGAGVRPHIRRGHLHTYWTGPLDGPRRAVVRWCCQSESTWTTTLTLARSRLCPSSANLEAITAADTTSPVAGEVRILTATSVAASVSRSPAYAEQFLLGTITKKSGRPWSVGSGWRQSGRPESTNTGLGVA